MRRIAGLCALVAVLALAGCGKTEGPSGAPDIEGSYTIVGMEVEGNPIPEDVLAKAPESDRVIKITADKMIASTDGKEDRASYKVDASRTPYRIDMTAMKGDKEETMYGIFKQDGDKLVLCFAGPNVADRPEEFKSTEKGKTMLMTLKKK